MNPLIPPKNKNKIIFKQIETENNNENNEEEEYDESKEIINFCFYWFQLFFQRFIFILKFSKEEIMFQKKLKNHNFTIDFKGEIVFVKKFL